MFAVSPAQCLMWGTPWSTFNSKVLTLFVRETTWASGKLVGPFLRVTLSNAYAKTQRIANKTDFTENIKIFVNEICDLVSDVLLG